MNAYFLPGTGIYGGIKVGFQFCELLDRLGAPIVIATPDGDAPQWFRSSVPVMSHSDALAMLTPQDTILFSLPHDYEWLAASGHRLVFHCQGTDPLIDPVIADPEVLLLSCWQQAADYVREHTGRQTVEVGISIADGFFFRAAERKSESVVATMPRRGAELIEQARQCCPQLQFAAIDGNTESDVARQMRQAGYFLATAEGEWFGLPALEAMAAGCVVLSVAVIGGVEYLRHGDNAMVCARSELATTLAALSEESQRGIRMRMRNAAVATARGYRAAVQQRRLATLLHGPLAMLT
jgi:glycosyltransferase involved in cell wall biosynthesis